MSTPSIDTLRAFLDALGPARHKFVPTQQTPSLVTTAIEHGYTAETLGRYVRCHDGYTNPDALMQWRLRRAAGRDEEAR